MKKYFLFILVTITFNFVSYGQCPTDGQIQLLSQSDIEEFAAMYPNCIDLQSNLQIAGPTVVDLSPLAGLATILGNLQIGSPVLDTGLVNLNGLNDLVSVGDLVIIHNNVNLISLSGLESLETIGGYLHIGQGGGQGEGNILLENLLPLSNLVSIGGELEIFDNNSLTDLSGLESLTSIAGALKISSNENLENLDALDYVEIDGSYIISGNESLQSLNIVDVSSGVVNIYGCPLESLSGLTISGPIFQLVIDNNSSLTSLEDITITFPLELELLKVGSLPIIVNLDGLENIYSASSLRIIYNDSLEDINVISNFNLEISNVISIYGNTNLSQCSIANLCQFLEGYGSDPFNNNDAGCNTKEEVLNVCIGCPYNENIQLLSQEDVDDMINYPTCTEIGDLLINGEDIVNLLPLQNLITANITITNNTLLTSLDGLQNIENSSDIVIENNPVLVDVSALGSISSVSNVRVKNNNLLTEIIGWNSLVETNNLKIINNPSLVSIIGLQNLNVNELIEIKDNISLPNLDGLQGVESPANLTIEGNLALTNIAALSNIQFSLDNLKIKNNDSLIHLDGLEGIENVGSTMFIEYNQTLENINGLSGLTNIGFSSSLYLIIGNNDNLTDISGIEFINPSSFNNIMIYNNPILSECSILAICIVLEDYTINFDVWGNAIGCNSDLEIEENCDVFLNTISGTILFDFNNDDCDANDYPVNLVLISATNSNLQTTNTITDASGYYELRVPQGEYTIQIVSELLSNNFISDPESVLVNFNSTGNQETVDFCISAITTYNDIKITMFPLNEARPGFDTDYQLIFENIGTTGLSGEITLQFNDARQTFLNAIPSEENISGDMISWSFSDLLPFQSRTIDIVFNTLPPPTNGSGDVLVFEATINPISGDENPLDNVYSLEQTIVNSQDPNDKLVMQGSQIYIDEVGNYLDYMVRFQNVGTADAINVRVDDLLSDNLNWNTFRPLSSSHEYQVEIIDGNQVSFIFDDIYLPSEDSDPEGSQGYISFQVRSLETLTIGDVVINGANIFFDFNDPISTGIVATTVVEDLSINDNNINKITIYPNPTKEILNVKANGSIIENIAIINLQGMVLKNVSYKNEIDVSNLTTGIYFIQMYIDGNTVTKKFIKE